MTSYKWSKEQIQKAKEDFRVFLFIVWDAVGLPEPTPVQYDIANCLQHLPNDRFIIQGFRGEPSHSSAVLFVCGLYGETLSLKN